ncbi:MAG: hypothetical protein CM1200mP1_13760 [Candidatus Neomarinimicrobiota bacterium]|nr:MAG: hypothetical protein CM1200mP1_13760 [Candidatus Neomarinimicrobiota bacterium]
MEMMIYLFQVEEEDQLITLKIKMEINLYHFLFKKNLRQDATSIISTVNNNGVQGIIVGNSNFESQLGTNSSLSNYNPQKKKYLY